MAEDPKAGGSFREKLMAFATVIAVVGFYSSYWHTPQKLEAAKLKSALEEVKKQQESNEKLLQTLGSTFSSAEKSKDDKSARLTLIRQANNNFSNIVRTLSGDDSKDNFVIKSLNAEKEETFADYSKVLFNLEVEAPFLSVGKFLEKIEKSDLLTELVSVEASRIDPELKRCTIKLKLYSYASRR